MTKNIRIEKNQIENDPMAAIDARFSRLEISVQQIQVDIARINTRLDTELPHLATKAELVAVEGRLETKLSSVEGRLETKIAAVEGNLETKIATVEGNLETKIATVEGKLRTEIVNSRNTIIIWLIGIAIATGFVNWYTSYLPYSHSNTIQIAQKP